MTTDFESLFRRIRARAESCGVAVRTESLGFEAAGYFDGLSVTVNRDYDAESRCYYLVHALGSIIEWCLDPPRHEALFEELRQAKADRRDSERLERAVEAYRNFETVSSEYAVWLLADLGHAEVIPSYTNFFRADLEALTRFHRQGLAPVWREFFAEWNRRVARGEQQVAPFTPRPVPPFTPVRMKRQEVLREIDGRG